MKRLMIAGAALALALTGCAHVALPSSGVAAAGDQLVLSGERAFGAAEVIYTAAAGAVGKAVDAGLIRGATATKVRGWNAAARGLLVKGKAAADQAEKARIAAQLLGIADKLNSLTGA